MAFVVDASVTACWLLPDEDDPLAAAAYGRFPDESAIAPALWWFEVRNLLIVNERRGRLDAARSDRALALLRRHPITIDRTPDEAMVLTLARRHGLTVYEAACLELALREALPLATLDQQLAAAARAENVALVGAGA